VPSCWRFTRRRAQRPRRRELEPDVLVDLKPVTLFWGAGAAGAKRYLERQLEA